MHIYIYIYYLYIYISKSKLMCLIFNENPPGKPTIVAEDKQTKKGRFSDKMKLFRHNAHSCLCEYVCGIIINAKLPRKISLFCLIYIVYYYYHYYYYYDMKTTTTTMRNWISLSYSHFLIIYVLNDDPFYVFSSHRIY
jgi:hypothetical protein